MTIKFFCEQSRATSFALFYFIFMFRHCAFLLYLILGLCPSSIICQAGGLTNALGALRKAETKSDSTLQTKIEKPLVTTFAVSDSLGNPQAQNVEGKIVFNADSSIVMLEKSKRGFREIKGYRVQLTIGSAEHVKKERNSYLSLGLPYSAYMKQIVPEYALQIGDFTTRMEMEKHLEKIKVYYPKAIAVVEVIEPPKFIKR